MQQTALLLINGKRVPAESRDTTVLKNPHDGRVVITVAEAGPGDIDLAVQNGIDSLAKWSTTALEERAKRLSTLARLLLQEKNELAHLESITTGKPITTALREVDTAAEYLTYYSGFICQNPDDKTLSSADQWQFRDPYGLCGMIMPWNYPLLTAVQHCAPALAMGNTVLLKPAVRTPLTTLKLGELALIAGFSPGVINVVTGRGPTTGESLVRHPQVPRISFCGSTTTGKEIMKYGAYELKRITMDLGGKSAAIIFSDADLLSATASVVSSIIGNSGQNQQAKSRLLVSRKIYDDVIEKLIENFSAVRVGNPSDPLTEMGPLISQRQQERVLKYIELGRSAGAKLLFGGKIPALEVLGDGYYIEPTLFGNVDPQMYIAREEIFGPILCVIPFDNDEEAVSITNDSIYGITASVWTLDTERAFQIAKKLDVGLVTINSDAPAPISQTVSRRKHSGMGDFFGTSALQRYSQPKTVIPN